MFVSRRLTWMVLILLIAAFLRWDDLPHIPPGMTHDEADHGLDAWGVVQGDRPIYFTVGYGREPLYDYSTALLMSFMGPTYLAGRLTGAFFSLILIAGTFSWVKQALGGKVALLGLLPKGAGIDWDRIIFKGLTVQGIYGRRMYETWYKMTQLVLGGFPLHKVLSHQLPAEDFQKGFDLMESGKSGKVVLNWN